MWISSDVYLKLREELATERGRNEAQAVAARALETTLDWLRVRLTQLEGERAVLISNYMGISIPTPSIVKAPKPEESPYHSVPHFHDVGDAEAARMGISWAEDGTVTYSKTS